MEAMLRAADAEANAQTPMNFFSAMKKSRGTFPRFCARLTKFYYRTTAHHPEMREAKEIGVTWIMERFIYSLPYNAQAYVHRRKPETVAQACSLAEEFFGNNRMSVANYKGNGQFHSRDTGGDRGQRRFGGQQQYQERGQRQRYYQQQQQRQPENKQEEKAVTPYKPPQHRGDSKSPKNTKGEKEISCFRCGELGHYSRQCKAKVDVKLLERLGSLPIDEKVTERGLVAGRDVKTIMLDTGADTSVISSDLVPEGTPTEGTVIMRGMGGTWMPCPYVSLPIFVKGKEVRLRALVLPRKIVG